MAWKRYAAILIILWMLITAILSVQSATVRVSIQRFENGLMIWRGDNSTIYVLGNGGSVSVFPSSVYSPLPDNPIFGTPPSRLRPIFGFGKVWGNYSAIRKLLGWPTLDEIGFDTSLVIQGKTVLITELDGSVIQINPTRTWQRNTPGYPTPIPGPTGCPYPSFTRPAFDDVCPAQAVTTSAAYQAFENGFMIWLANTGDVWVFFKDGSRWVHIVEADYAQFSDAPGEQPPEHRIQPINGFGRVWYNFLDESNGQLIRYTLGWAVSQETGYTATTQLWGRASHVHLYVTIPNGRIIDVYSGLAGVFWSWIL